ncbi:MAG: protein-glutamate O-methyltransferase CheR [Oscillospiraceae bacterium]|jgi:chemotaxis protein methyltransferase CheR|nr:protein-glutamate O-methyltransferase CheR [Oscillospiraceae bacterium]
MDTLQTGSQIDSREYMLLRDYVMDICGVFVPPEKSYLFETRLSRLMLEAGAGSLEELYAILKSRASPILRQKVIDAITTNETLWFRDEAPWVFLKNKLLPKFTEQLASGAKKRVRIWSAAASTGQEIYSAVMCVHDYLSTHKARGVDLSRFEFVATDICERVLGIARKGRYDRIGIRRGLSDYYKNKYFTQSDSAFDIDPLIRDAVTFSRFNLLDTCRALGPFDIIFCRYVLIYFNDDTKKKVLANLRGALADTGILLTGNYVFIGLFDEGYDTRHHENLTYYTKKGRAPGEEQGNETAHS